GDPEGQEQQATSSSRRRLVSDNTTEKTPLILQGCGLQSTGPPGSMNAVDPTRSAHVLHGRSGPCSRWHFPPRVAARRGAWGGGAVSAGPAPRRAAVLGFRGAAAGQKSSGGHV